ncbi:ATP-dependent RNA helicase DHX30 [Pygocentrus nattereri]|uniref:ATP-dependent RNA helicase DHX30 n=1 Tax=Pygocentrus nattereri TaxID=42514 RepID=A0AAR2JYH6_PYGNA|nr:ATP-dependent RNA helicase DHX30 [Pygocentrus nattereri]
MAAHCAGMMRVRTLCKLLTRTVETRVRIGSSWSWTGRYRTRAEHRGGAERNAERGQSDVLMEFPQAKSLLHSTLCRSLGRSDVSQYIRYHCTDGEVKRATVTLLWPQRIEVEGFGSRKVEAERRAAAAACHRLRELGVLGPGNQLPRRRLAKWQSSFLEDADEDVHDRLEPSGTLKNRTRGTAVSPRLVDQDPKVSEALAIFSKPKALLVKVVQVATSSTGIRELLQYRTVGGKVKECQLTLHWPEKMTFTGLGRHRLEAETRAAALACLRLKELNLLDEQNNPLTHAKYHQEEVREAGERERRPCRVEIPEDLEQRIRGYLTQYPLEAEMQKLWDEEEEQVEWQQSSSLAENDEEDVDDDDDPILDPITGRPYHALSSEEAELLSSNLQKQWERAGPARGVELPVDSHRERLVEAVETSRVLVVAGETGCGKTTRIPRFLLEGRVRGGAGAHCNILVTQPRRISAVSVAQRVSQEIGPTLRHCVGYQVRLESRPPERSGGALLFLTVGVLLRKLQSNPFLQGVSHVLVDEVHERDVNTDLLLALLRCALRENPELRVVLMSATGDTHRLAQYFGGCPVEHVPGFMYPVKERYLEDVLKEMRRQPKLVSREETKGQDDASPDLDLVADVIDHIHLRGEPGAVLCFLPGWQEIKAVQQKLEEKQTFKSGSQMVLPLHSSMSVADQQAVFQCPPEGQRKIVLATNIAETSITINDIVHVVDTGSQKEQSYDPRTKVSCLDTVWISRSNVTQRRGRAGRCQPGHAYHLFPQQKLDALTTFPIPEILRTPLESLVVQAKIYSPQSKAVDFLSQVLDSPEHGAVKDAVKILQDIGVLDGLECLTPLGKRVACISCDPRLGKALVLSALFRCVLPMLSVVASLTRDPFHNSMQNRALVNKAKEALSGSSCSDYLVFSRAVQGWKELGDRQSRQEYLDLHTLSGTSLHFIHGLTQQFSENLVEAELAARSVDCLRPSSRLNQHSHQEQLLKAMLLAGFYPNLIQVKRGTVTKGGRFRPDNLSYRTQSGPVLLHRSSVNRGERQLPSRWLTFFSAVKSNGNVFIRDSSAVHPLSLLLLTDCDLVERAYGDQVEVAMPGRSLVRWEMSAQSWELLWELRTSLQAMVHRNLQALTSDSVSKASSTQDDQLISLLVDLLNNTEPAANGEDHSDGE